MGRSFSKSQINALGDRLRHAARPSSADSAMLQQLRLDYDDPLRVVEDTLRANGLSPTSRLKTIGTIVDKLRRERTRLSTMQDIAGVRLVVGGGLEEQDRVVEVLTRLFPSATVLDRRQRPNHGYRAVHVVAEVESCPIEVQVRTRMQDGWAQVMEKLADLWGRQIRYGEPSNEPDTLVGSMTQRDRIDAWMKYSEMVADIEGSLASGSIDRLDRLLDEAQRLLNRLST